MNYRIINLRAHLADTANTELMYEIAASRADKVDLIRLNIDMTDPESKRIVSQIIKTLKFMKQKGSIQFFATPESFELMRTEAVFLINKYPDRFDGDNSTVEGESYIFIKL